MAGIVHGIGWIVEIGRVQPIAFDKFAVADWPS